MMIVEAWKQCATKGLDNGFTGTTGKAADIADDAPVDAQIIQTCLIDFGVSDQHFKTLSLNAYCLDFSVELGARSRMIGYSSLRAFA